MESLRMNRRDVAVLAPLVNKTTDHDFSSLDMCGFYRSPNKESGLDAVQQLKTETEI
jgi:hypothetical protein